MRYSYGLILFLVLSGVCALITPPGLADPVRKISVLLEPVSFPVRHVAWRLSSKFGPRRPTPSEDAEGTRTLQQVTDEKQALKSQVELLQLQNDELQQQLKTYRTAREDKNPVRVVPVVAAAPAPQQVLVIQSFDEMAPKMVVRTGINEMVGMTEVVGLGAAHVRLVTDKSSAVAVKFAHYSPDTQYTALPQLPKVARGTGDGKMVISDMKRDEAFPKRKEDQLAAGDRVRVMDGDLPRGAQNLVVGEIESVKPGKQPLFVTVVIRPLTDLMKLPDVAVLTNR